MCFLELDETAKEAVIFSVGYQRIIENVIAVIVVTDLFPEVLDLPFDGPFG
jgi:hypothetical protein